MINKKENKGITLIALVITIIVVLILASITIGRLKGKDTIKESQAAKTSAEILGEKQILNIAVEASMEKHKFGEVEGNYFKNELDKNIGEGKYFLDENTLKDKFIVTFTQSGRVYLVDKFGNLDNYFGIINIDVINQTSNSITISVNADSKNGMPDEPQYNYYIKKTTERKYPETPKYTGTDINHTFSDLEQDTNYTIKVTTKDSNGNELIGEKEATTEKIPGGTINGYITFGTPEWSGGLASITISSNTSYKIQYQVNSISGSWNSIANGGKANSLDHKDTVYARLTDGKNYGEYASVTILDGIAPIISSFGVTAYDTTTISVQTSAVDNETGIESYKYEYKKSTETTYTIAATTTSSTYTYTNLTDNTEYNLRVTVKDKAGNETVSNATQKTPIANIAPVLTNVSLNGKTTSSITIAARATDADGDNLTYMLYTGTSTSNLSLANTSSSIAQGTQTTLSQSGLSEYTDYYYRIDVTDGKATTQGSVNSVRTYCPGGSTTTVSCGTCGGDGKVAGGSESCNCGGKTSSYSGKCGCGASVSGTTYKCTKWGITLGTKWTCSSCGRTKTYSPSTHVRASSSTCGTCNGEGSKTVTQYCSHNKIGQHDD